MSTASTSRATARAWLGGRELTLLLLCLVAGAVFAALSPAYLGPGNVAAVLRNSVELLLVGLGLTLLLAMGGIDVTVGIVLGLAAIAIGKLLLAGFDPWLAAAAGPLVGLAVGLVTGCVVVFGRIPAIVATIGLLGVYRTAIFVALGGNWLSGLPPTLSTLFSAHLFGAVPVSYLAVGAIYTAAYLGLRKTPFGLHLLAIGNNEERARLAGIAVRGVRLAAYAVSGALCGVAATFYVSTYRNVEMTVGSTLALDAIAAVVLGGTSIVGGRASLLGTVLGVFLIRILQNGFTVVGLPSLWQPVVTGALLLLSLLIERAVGSRPWARLKPRAA
jgi:ribose/xylose/arabinose/galactoside ABC-type transport system permease subunit